MNRPFVFKGRTIPGVYQRCREGCVDPCKAHAWSYRVELPAGPTGKRRQFAKDGFTSGSAARVAREAIVSKHRDGLLLDDDRTSLAGWLRQWLTDRVGTDSLRPATERSYRDHIERYLVPRLGAVRLADLRPEHISAMYREIQAEREHQRREIRERNAAVAVVAEQWNAAHPGRRARTPVKHAVPRPFGATSVRRLHSTLRSALSAAEKRGLVVRNVAKLAEVPRISRPSVKVWQPADVGRFLAHVHEADPRMYPLVRVAVMAGLRRGELRAGLKWAQVDLDHARIVVDRQRSSVGYVVSEAAPKSEASNRAVDIDAGTVKVLRDLVEVQALDADMWGDAYQAGGYVFTRSDGAPWHPDRISKVFAKLVRDSGLPPARLHDMRHLAASLRLASGADMAVVSKQLGHSTVSLTSDTYSHLIGTVGRDTSQRAADLVDGTRGP